MAPRPAGRASSAATVRMPASISDRARSVSAIARPAAWLSVTSAGAYSSRSGARAWAIAGCADFGEVRQTIGDLPVHVGEQNVALVVESGREMTDHFSRTCITAAVQRRKIAVRPVPAYAIVSAATGSIARGVRRAASATPGATSSATMKCDGR